MPQTYGFEQTRERRIPELGAVLHEYTHAKSGARLCWLERADENKTFCAAFRTLPFDDSGVFHILEHSVLCGSRNYHAAKCFCRNGYTIRIGTVPITITAKIGRASCRERV